jgi:hypothetical protein
MAEQPNDASRKSKAEGERYDSNADEQAAGITNRPLDEELENQESLPRRGESKPGAHAGHGETPTDDRRSDR